MKDICFTKLGTVRCSEFELITMDFVNKMTQLIMTDVDNNNVFHNDEDDSFVVRYNSYDYQVKYGKELLTSNCRDKNVLDYLNKLVILSSIQKQISDEAKRRKDEVKEKNERLIMNARNDILTTVEEMKTKIDLLKKDDDENKTRVFKEFIEYFKNISIGELPEYNVGIRGALVFFAVLSLLFYVLSCIPGLITYITIWVPIISAIPIIDGAFLIKYLKSSHLEGYAGVYRTIFLSFSFPFILAKYGVKRLIEKIKLSHNIKKVNDLIKKTNGTKKAKPFKKNEQVDKILESLNQIKDNEAISISFTEFNELKNVILNIKNEEEKKKCFSELYQIVDNCVKLSGISVKDKNRTYSVFLNQIASLRGRIEEALNKEENSYYKLMTEVNEKIEETKEEYAPQKKIGRR